MNISLPGTSERFLKYMTKISINLTTTKHEDIKNNVQNSGLQCKRRQVTESQIEVFQVK